MVDLTTREERKGSRKGILWFVLVLILAMLIIGILWAVSRNNRVDSPSILGDSRKNPLLADVDNDGLPQWEEEIYGTDPQNKDTDGDGTPDGEEVRNRRNPLVRGPDDLVSVNQTISGGASASSSGNLTQKLFEEFIRQGGVHAIIGQKDSRVASQILNQEADRLIQQGLSQKEENDTEPNLKIKEDASSGAVIDYLNQVTAIFEINIAPIQKDDLDLTLEILQSGDLERLNELSRYREATERALSQIKNLSVPKNLAWFHKKEIEYLKTTVKQLAVLEGAGQDPVAALAVIPQRVDLKIEIIKFHQGELPIWLDKENIILAPKEKAYALTQ